MSILTLSVILLLLMDPLGNLSSYLAMVDNIAPRRRRIIVLREMGFALLIMIVFYLIGEFVLSTLKISEATIRITSGIILFLIALKILFSSHDSLRANLPVGEPFVTPLAIPLIAGPALIASIMLFAMTEAQQPLIFAIFISWAIATLILLFARRIVLVLGQNGLDAIERMLGMVLVMLAIQRTLEGIQTFIPMYCK